MGSTNICAGERWSNRMLTATTQCASTDDSHSRQLVIDSGGEQPGETQPSILFWLYMNYASMNYQVRTYL